ncbi:MAG: phosphoribosylglycinamide formyltransferase 1, partial [Frankiales bacterium]|nr:phosphoribosylglycinamide formyltransferase 1 [Frankiales bacterium]
MSFRLVVLVSGTGTNLQALLDACLDPAYGCTVVAVGAEKPGTGGVARALAAGVDSFVVPFAGYPVRADWDAALAEAIAAYEPDLVVLAGFMRILGPPVLERFPGRVINTHPALLPSFPGAHAVRDAL